MATIKKTCGDCGEEFRVTTSTTQPVQFCPFCGEEVFEERPTSRVASWQEDEDEDDDDYDEDGF